MKRRTFLKGLLLGATSSVLPNTSFASGKSVRVGVVSDLEGAFDNISKSVKKLKKQKVDLIIMQGMFMKMKS
jgi:hypothetical protein